jgi:indole-3-glycerol phosphate synthase
MGFLTDVVGDVRRRLQERPLDDPMLLARATSLPPPRDFVRALREEVPSVIAEVKRASPSAGSFADDADPGVQARAYATGGAAAISVLTEPAHFHGSLLDLHAVRLAVDLPLLRKDFLVSPSQVIEARAHGADAVLLITACLNDGDLAAMLACANDLGMGVLVEVHSDGDVERALASAAPAIGVNARDLETLDVDIDRALERLRMIPTDRVAVLESGISTRAHVEAAVAAGASGILVGDALMRASDPVAKLRELRGEEIER